MTNTVQIPNDQMIFSVQELKDKGFSYYKINQMVDKGICTVFVILLTSIPVYPNP